MILLGETTETRTGNITTNEKGILTQLDKSCYTVEIHLQYPTLAEASSKNLRDGGKDQIGDLLLRFIGRYPNFWVFMQNRRTEKNDHTPLLTIFIIGWPTPQGFPTPI